MSDDLCTVEFPEHFVVLGRREKRGQRAEVLPHPVVLKGISREKALKFAHVADAKVTDAEGNVLAKPTIEVTDKRAEAADERAAKLADENAELRDRLDRLEAALERKADRPGPKPGTKSRK